MEEKALSKEKDKASQERLAEVRKELAALEDRLRPLMVRSPCAPTINPETLTLAPFHMLGQHSSMQGCHRMRRAALLSCTW